MLEIGTKAPEFVGVDENGNEVSLNDFKGKKLVLYFYPKDSTPGCTAEACDLRDNYHRYLALGYQVLGVSKDSQASHRKFIEKYSLPFHLDERSGMRHSESLRGLGAQETLRKGVIRDIEDYLCDR